MAAYYNELDPFAAAWLRELIKEKLIADGEVDERSIELVSAADVRGFTQCHFFAGIGGWSYALRLARWPDDREVWTGSCPCQPFSEAGKGLVTDDPRHLWPTWIQLISESRPDCIFGEQVASADGLAWFDLVCFGLEAQGYAVAPFDFGASSVGAPHKRQRLYWVADTAGEGRCGREAVAGGQHAEPRRSGARVRDDAWPDGYGRRSALHISDVLSPSYGIPGRVGRLRGYGNSIVPEAAKIFIEAYCEARNIR